MNVNITLVTTSTWPDVGPRRFGRVAAAGPDEAASDGFEGGSSAAITVAFRGESIRLDGQVDDYNGLATPPSREEPGWPSTLAAQRPHPGAGLPAISMNPMSRDAAAVWCGAGFGVGPQPPSRTDDDFTD